jgi:hypothetical protein
LFFKIKAGALLSYKKESSKSYKRLCITWKTNTLVKKRRHDHDKTKSAPIIEVPLNRRCISNLNFCSIFAGAASILK